MKKTSKNDTKDFKRPIKIAKIIAIVIAVLGILIGIQVYRQSKIQSLRRAIMEEQRQVLVDGWKAQGMTDEQIQQKLQLERPSRNADTGQSRGGFGIMRLFGGGSAPGGVRN